MSIYKKKDPNLCTNYRPISLLSPFSKILEKLIFVRICSHLIKYDMLSKQQFGFRKNMSSAQTICSIHVKIIKNIECSLYTCCVILDLTKAFDAVNHAILLHKIEHDSGVRGLLLQLFKSYLLKRYQCTKINNYKSSLLKVSCGVPQGSSLDPLLFLLYINDLPQVSRFDTTLFADDTILSPC